MRALLLILVWLAGPLSAEALVAAKTIRPQQVITVDDLALANITIADSTTNMDDLIGKEVRRAIYAGRPVRLSDVREPALVERNQVIQLEYSGAGLLITTEGRALERAGAGEWIRVMNLASRSIVTAMITPAGTAVVN